MYYPKKLARPSQVRSCKLLSKVIQNVDKELKRKSHDGLFKKLQNQSRRKQQQHIIFLIMNREPWYLLYYLLLVTLFRQRNQI